MLDVIFILIYVYFLNCLYSDDRLILEQANILENKTLSGESVKFISGNVILKKGDLTLKCDQGRQYESNDLAVLYEKVSALKNGQTLTCDTIKFYSKNNKLLSIGKSHIWDSDYDLKADTIIVFTKIDSGVALGNVSLIQKGQTIKANRIEYQKHSEQDGVSYTASGNVVIQDSIQIATCGKAKYNREPALTLRCVRRKVCIFRRQVCWLTPGTRSSDR